MPITLRQLRYFVVVAEELHFGRAAERLSISQPPLSQQIMALEESLGVLLFNRTKRSVTLTPVGQQWLPTVKRVLNEVEELPEKARQLARGEIGMVSLAFVSTADYGLLPDLLRRYRAKHPDVHVQLREATSDVQIEALLDETLDAGIVISSHGLTLPNALAYLPLQSEPLMVAIPEDWLHGGRVAPTAGPIDFAALLGEPLIVFPRQSAPAFYDSILDYYARWQVMPHFGQEAIQMQTIVSLVSAGLGIALVPASLRHLQRTGVVYCQLESPAPTIETGLLWRKRSVSPALEGLIAAARASKLVPGGDCHDPEW